jgi:hypothetical protein
LLLLQQHHHTRVWNSHKNYVTTLLTIWHAPIWKWCKKGMSTGFGFALFVRFLSTQASEECV